jgi:arylsulfatase A-like enzyme
MNFLNKSLNRRQFLKYGFYSGLSAGLGCNLLLGGCSRKRSGRKNTNVILITVDTLRADHLGCYGYHKNTSPNLDTFARESLLFENCFSHAPNTGASCASILSGFLPHETNVFHNSFPLPADVVTCPKIFKMNNYNTMAVVSNYVLRRKKGWSAGFDIFDDNMEDYEPVRHLSERIAEHTTRSAVNYLERNHQERFFMWIHYQDPHGPYTPPARYEKLFYDESEEPRLLKFNESVRGVGGIPSYQRLGANRDFYFYVSQYDGEIRYFDENFKRLMDALRRLELYDNSLIIFSSDHGEGMGERDYYFAHGKDLYGNVTHVPLIIKHGNKLTGRREDFVQHIDIVPTILRVLGLKTDLPLRGYDLRVTDTPQREIFAEKTAPNVSKDADTKFSIVVDGLKLIHSPMIEKYELYDLRVDTREQHDIIDDKDKRNEIRSLKAALSRMRDEDLLRIGAANKPLDFTEEEKEKLKSLGYIQ